MMAGGRLWNCPPHDVISAPTLAVDFTVITKVKLKYVREEHKPARDRFLLP